MAAMEDVWGHRPLRARGGGSLPILSTFAEVLRVPVLLLGFGLPDDRPHSPNEKLDLPQFYGGIRSRCECSTGSASWVALSALGRPCRTCRTCLG